MWVSARADSHAPLEEVARVGELTGASEAVFDTERVGLGSSQIRRVTASLGVAASSDGEKEILIADADAALYAAKRQGKNRVMKAQPETANVCIGE